MKILSPLELIKLVNSENNFYFEEKVNTIIFLSYENKYLKKGLFNFKKEIIISKVFYNYYFKKSILRYKFDFFYYLFIRGKGNGIIEIDDTDFRDDILELYSEIYLKTMDSQKFLDLGFKILNVIGYGFLDETLLIHNQNDLQRKIKEITITKIKPKLLLHSCCGPCSSYLLESLAQYFDFDIIYYNPNIYNQEEYLKRINTQKQILIKLGLSKVNLFIFPYEYDEFLDYIKGHELDHEGGRRCFLCYQFRLKKANKFFNNFNYDYFTTTLSISPYKNEKYINDIGLKLNSKFLYSNFKVNDGYKKSLELSKKYNLYRQDYCGCQFSIRK